MRGCGCRCVLWVLCMGVGVGVGVGGCVDWESVGVCIGRRVAGWLGVW